MIAWRMGACQSNLADSNREEKLGGLRENEPQATSTSGVLSSWATRRLSLLWGKL